MAVQTEQEANWKGAYIETPTSVVDIVNFISSHVFYRIANGDDVQLKLKGRLILQINRNKYDFATALQSATPPLQTS